MAESYTVNLGHRVAGGQWQWEYLDHESTRWSEAKITWDESKHCISVFRSGDLVKEIPLKELETPAKTGS
ncbi:MAG: hypothetical protein ACI9R3_000066 [Verrucomicrobiales bacterium]|jgi:hypothetical protein